jgi:hypothetical protein
MHARLRNAYGVFRGDTTEQRTLSACIAIALIVAVTRILYETRNYYFFSDDFLNFIMVREMGFRWSYFMRDFTGEFVPMVRVANLMYFTLFHLAFWPFRIMLAIGQCALILLIASLGVRRGASALLLIPALTLLACSPIYGTPFQWWSAALNVLAGGFCSLVAICQMSGPAKLSARQTIAAGVWFTVGMLFYPKGLYVAAIMYAVRVFVAVNDARLPLRAALLRSAAEIWPVFPAGIGYVATVLIGRYRPGVAPPDLGLLLNYVWRGWNHGFLTGIFGLDQPFFGRIFLANAAVLALAAVSVVRNRNAAILWLGFAVYFLFSIGTIAVNRAVPFGLGSSETGRYYADMMSYWLAVSVIAFGPAPSTLPRRTSWALLALVICLSIAGAWHLLLASARVPYLWFVPPKNVELYVDNMRAALAQTSPATPIEDSTVPDWVMPKWMFPYSQCHLFLKLFRWHGPLVPAKDAQLTFTPLGKLVPTHHS